MKRREFLIQSGLGCTLAGLLPGTTLWGMPGPDYTGPLFVMVDAGGGWDVTSFCDPKMNVPNELEINHWARNAETGQAGNLRYAPFAGNQAFFDKYYRDMLVINGIDAQTNSHDTGVVHNWSGRLAAGYPSMPALLAAIYSPSMPIAWINNGSYSETANLIRFTRMDNPFLVKNIAFPNRTQWDNSPFIVDEEWSAMQAAQRNRLIRLRNAGEVLPWQKAQRDVYFSARENADSLAQFADKFPSEENLEPDQFDGEYLPLRRQAQLALLAFQSGVAMTADLYHGPFDTHVNHDGLHASGLAHVTDSVDYLWQYAEQLGLADRLTVFITSDFGRTPYYNETDGKDHWPIGSAIIMQKNAPWGNRVVGLTDAGHNAIAVNPHTLQPDSSNNGTIIYPKHVITAFRELAGIDGHPITQRFQLANTTPFDMFNPAKQTPQGSGDPRNTLR